jgi:hypothetical protein
VAFIVKAIVGALALLLLVVEPARAQDPFEIQVYDGTANPAGVPGVELHLNDWATGHREGVPPEAPLHGQFHATVEPSLGVTPWWELGAYIQSAVRTDDGVVDWAGAKLRSKFVTPPGYHPHLRFGVNLELSYLPSTYDRDVWGTEVRPIAAWHDREWLFAFNPIFDQSLAGPGASDGPSFDPAAKASHAWGRIALGLEYYGSIGPLASPLPPRQEAHYIYETFELVEVPNFELNIGIGEGLTPASAGIVMKAIVGYTFEPFATQSPARASSLRASSWKGHRP